MKKDNIIKIIAIILLFLVILIVTMFVKSLNTDVIENHSFYQYFIGKKFDYEGTLKLTRKKDITELTFKDKQVQLDSTPIYYSDVENKVLFPENMAIIYPVSNGLAYKINHFSNIYIDSESVYLQKGEWKKNLQNSFIYDGNDLYFFLETTKISVNDTQYELSPLSYVIAKYNEGLEIYNKKSDEYIIIEAKNQEILAKTDSYTINLSIDAIKYGEKEQLLIKNIDYLKNIE